MTVATRALLRVNFREGVQFMGGNPSSVIATPANPRNPQGSPVTLMDVVARRVVVLGAPGRKPVEVPYENIKWMEPA